MTNILKRGDFLKPIRPVSLGTPSFLHPLHSEADEEPSRLALAKWIAARESPTTARVFVNRIWQSDFGTGLVATPEDFGVRADEASHPGAARLAGGGIHGPGLEYQGDPQADRDLGATDRRARSRPRRLRRTRTTACSPEVRG